MITRAPERVLIEYKEDFIFLIFFYFLNLRYKIKVLNVVAMTENA